MPKTATMQGAYLAALYVGMTRLLGITGGLHTRLKRAYDDARVESYQFVLGFACVQAFKLHNAAFKGFVFFAERRLAFVENKSGIVGVADLGDYLTNSAESLYWS